MCFLHVCCVSLVVLSPWVQDLHKPSNGCFYLGPTFSCGITFPRGGVPEIKVVLPLIRDVERAIWSNYELIGSNTQSFLDNKPTDIMCMCFISQNSVSVFHKKKKMLFFWAFKNQFPTSSSTITCRIGSDGYRDFEMPYKILALDANCSSPCISAFWEVNSLSNCFFFVCTKCTVMFSLICFWKYLVNQGRVLSVCWPFSSSNTQQSHV